MISLATRFIVRSYVVFAVMSNHRLRFARSCFAWQRLLATVLTGSLVSTNFGSPPPAKAQTTAYCQLTAAATQEKETLRQSALQGNTEAQNRYRALVNQHAQILRDCRNRTWPQTQAVWLRLYPCDLQPGVLDKVMDRVVNRGYNQVYIEVFYDGQVLLPTAANPTVWPSVVRTPGSERTDLLAQAIQKGRDRGLKVYAWMFMMNFGYSYGQRPDRQSVLARNSKGDTSLYVVDNASQVFIDPYNLQAKRDYYQLILEVIRRRPDGVLFDYVRYPRGSGAGSVVNRVQDLWIHSEAAQQALNRRALNYKGLNLIQRFVSKGYITAGDIEAIDKLYPQEGEPLWQGRTPPPAPQPPNKPPTAAQRQPQLQWELWQLSVAHAIQGIIDFLAVAAWPVQRQGMKAGAVFFPDGNQSVGRQGYDSRLQPWDRFPTTLEWHPMSYAACNNTSCIAALVQRVLQYAPSGTQVIPAIAGVWGKPISNRPSLEAQMQALRAYAPRLQGVSHFALSWQEPQLESERKSCRVH